MRIRRMVIAPAIVMFYSLLLVAGCTNGDDNGNGNQNQNTNQNTNQNDNQNTNQNTNRNDNQNTNQNTNQNDNGTDMSLGNLFTSTFDSSDSSVSSQVFEFDGDTVELVRRVFTHVEPGSNPHFVFGPDGDIYSSLNDKVQRISSATGELIESFITPGSGGMTSAGSLVFGTDGDLYVINADREILQFDGGTGDFVRTLVTAGTGGLEAPLILRIGPNGNLFVLNVVLANSQVSVLEYNATTGAFEGEFVGVGTGGVVTALDMAFGPNGNLYIPDSNGGVAEFSGASGASLGTFFNGLAITTFPTAVTFGPDDHLYVLAAVGQNATPAIVKINGATGEVLDTFFRNEVSFAGYLLFKTAAASP